MFVLARTIFLFSFVLLSSFAMAEDKPETPTELKGGTIVTADVARNYLGQADIVFLDVRAPINFGKSHVPKSILVAYKEKSASAVNFDASEDSFDLKKLPADKNTKIVFYSDGPRGWKSYKGAVVAIKAGYINVQWMREGFSVWKDKKFPIEQ